MDLIMARQLQILWGVSGYAGNGIANHHDEESMKLKNSMEDPVRSRLARVQEEHAGDDSVCWCPLCRADMIALALSTLPPRYGTNRRPELGDEHAQAVRDAVSGAVRQVKRFPKHARDGATASTDPVWVVNYPLEESFHVVDSLLTPEHACDCWDCRCDMVAFALNRYPARYGVEHGGHTHLLQEDREQMRGELASFLTIAAQLVTRIPRHELLASPGQTAARAS